MHSHLQLTKEPELSASTDSNNFTVFHLDDTGYSSFNSSALMLDNNNNKENNDQLTTVVTGNERKVCLYESINMTCVIYLFCSHDGN